MQHYKIETDAHGREIAQHGSPAFPCGTYDEYFSMFFNEEVPWHWHEEIEIVLVVEGSTRVQCINHEVVIAEGEMVFINANALHRLTQHSHQDCRILNVVFSPNLLTGFMFGTIYQKHILPILQNSNLQMFRFSSQISWQSECIRMMRSAFEHWHNSAPDKEITLQIALMSLWHSLSNNLESPQGQQQRVRRQETRIQTALEFIQQNYKEPITIDDICHITNISSSECYRLFRTILKNTPTGYVTEHRLRMAALSLHHSQLTIAQIAFDSGFNCPAYFTKKFRQQYGVTPKEFRRKIP